jgi:hypothetical protein
MRLRFCVISGLLLCLGCAQVARGASRQSVEEKLACITDYVPQAADPVDQLIEVGRRFKIPMAIEWIERSGFASQQNKSPLPKRSVRELLEQIASVSPEHRVEVVDGLVRIYSPNDALHPFNFLNIRLPNYSVMEGDLFAAENQLRWAIRFTLEPEKYVNGFAGGYGYGANHIFEIPKFTVTASNVTIREVLNRIAVAQGNALWVVEIKSADLTRDEPHWKQTSVEEGLVPITSAWRFFPLAEIEELAEEHVAIDLRIADLLDQRMTTIPVMLEHGLAGSAGGATGGSSSEGKSFEYHASIEKIGKDFVTISVHVKVGWTGEADLNFEEKLQINRNAITEVSPEARIRIRAYLERGRANGVLVPTPLR